MRTFDHVDNKLWEANFFIERMEESEFNWFAMRCYFSAFVSSARSVTFAMQASMKGVQGFQEWYEKIRLELRENQIARFFHNCRTDDQKIGFNNIVGGSAVNGKSVYWFGGPDFDIYQHIPKTDVLTTCKSHMTTVCSIVDKAYCDFGFEIDPDQLFTLAGMTKLKLSLEDLEEFLGFPRGYTDIEWDGEDKNLIRLENLRREIPGSCVKPLLFKYLGRELSYPTEPFRAPR